MTSLETAWVLEAVSRWLRAPSELLACPDSLDPDRLGTILEQNRLLPLFQSMYLCLPQGEAWIRSRERLESVYQNSLLQGLRQLKSGQTLMETLARAGIGSRAVRGPFFAEDVYGDSALRLSSDIDILVSLQDRRRAWKVCQAAGYRSLEWESPLWPLDRHRIHWRLQREGDPVVCELHWAVEPVYGAMTLDYEALVRDSTPTQQFLSLCLHAGEHILERLGGTVRRCSPQAVRRCSPQAPSPTPEEAMEQGMLFRWLDVAMFLRKYGDVLDWDCMDRQARDRRVSSSLVLCLKGVRDWFGLSLPGEVDLLLLKWEESALRQRSLGLRRRLEVWWEGRFTPGGLQTSLPDVLYFLSPHAAFFAPSSGITLMLRRVRHSIKAFAVLSLELMSYACFASITAIRKIAATERASHIERSTSLNVGGALRRGDLSQGDAGGHL